MTQPNKQHLLLWVKGLLSKQYAQGKGQLARICRPDGPWEYCCMGVACEVAIAHGLELPVVERQILGYTHRQYGASGDLLVLPMEVQQWLGLDTANPMLGRWTAIGANDVEHFDFERIARLIIGEFGLEEDVDGDTDHP